MVLNVLLNNILNRLPFFSLLISKAKIKQGDNIMVDVKDMIEIGNNALIPNSAINIGNGTSVLLDCEELIPIINDSGKDLFMMNLKLQNVIERTIKILKKYARKFYVFETTFFKL